MKVRSHPSAQAFLDESRAFRAGTPALTSVIGSVATGVAAGRRHELELWLTIENEVGDVVGCAIRTSRCKLTVSDMPPTAVEALGQALPTLDSAPSGLVGPRLVVDGLVAALGLHDRARLDMEDVVRVLRELVQPSAQAAGAARAAMPSDVVRLTQLLGDFGQEAGVVMADPGEIAARLISEGRVWVWCVGYEVVACAAHAPIAETPAGDVGRIGSVFTERTHRRHGFGSALTHHVAQYLLTRCSTVLLYADAANVTSNHIYEELGFEEVARLVDVTIAHSAAE